jgi:hypothetical protein
MYAELANGNVQAGPKRDINIYDCDRASITKSWVDYAGATRFTYIFKNGQVPIPMKLVSMLKVASTGYLVPVFEVRGGDPCESNFFDAFNELLRGGFVVEKAPRQPRQSIAPPMAVPTVQVVKPVQVVNAAKAVKTVTIQMPSSSYTNPSPAGRKAYSAVRRGSSDSTECVYKASLL